MKKLLCAVLAAVLLFTALLLPAGAENGARYRVSAVRANVLPEPSVELTPVMDVPKGTVLTEEGQSGSFIKVTIRSAGVTGWVHLGAVTPITAGQTDIRAIEVTALPEKTVYVEGEESFDRTGFALAAVHTDGSKTPVTGYRLFVPSFSTWGEKTVDVVYTVNGVSFYTAFPVEVRRVPIERITLLSAPDKTSYIEHEPLDLSGLRVEVAYLDGRETETYTADEIVGNPAFLLLGCHAETPGAGVPYGEHTLHLQFRYSEIEVSFSLSARRRKIVSLRVKTPPDKTTVYTRETPDLTGMTLEAAYDNGEKETVPADKCVLRCDPEAFVLGPGNKIGLTYEGLSVEYALTYALDEPQSIRLRTPTVLTFILGERIALDDLKVFLVYRSGKEEETTDFTLSRIDPRRTGAQTVTVTSGSFSEVFTIYITPYYQKGDVDYDAEVTAADARIALRAAVKLVDLKGRPFNAADADRDGGITAADARLILRAAVGLEELLHFEDEGE